MGKAVHENSWRTEIFRSQSCGCQIASHRISQTIRGKYFESTELLSAIIRDFFEIIWDIWIHELEYFLLMLLLVPNSVVVYLIYFIIFRLWALELLLIIPNNLTIVWLLLKFNFISVLFRGNFTVKRVLLPNFLYRTVFQSFLKGLDQFLLFAEMGSILLLFYKQWLESVFNHVLGSLAVEILDNLSPFSTLWISQLEEFHVFLFTPTATNKYNWLLLSFFRIQMVQPSLPALFPGPKKYFFGVLVETATYLVPSDVLSFLSKLRKLVTQWFITAISILLGTMIYFS